MPGLTRRVVHQVIVRIVELATQERHRIVATGTPARRLHVPVALQQHVARLHDRGQIGRVVERTQTMLTLLKCLVHIGVAFLAVVIHHQRAGGDEIAVLVRVSDG